MCGIVGSLNETKNVYYYQETANYFLRARIILSKNQKRNRWRCCFVAEFKLLLVMVLDSIRRLFNDAIFFRFHILKFKWYFSKYVYLFCSGKKKYSIWIYFPIYKSFAFTCFGVYLGFWVFIMNSHTRTHRPELFHVRLNFFRLWSVR